MKNLNLLLAASIVLSASSIFAAEPTIDVARAAVATSLRQAALDKNPKCKFSPNKKFFAVMTRDEKDRGTSVTVYNLETNTVVVTVAPEKTTIRDFKLTDTTLVVKYRRYLKSVTYTLEVQCKKCKRTLDGNCADCRRSVIGTIAKARAFGFVPAAKK